MPFSQEQSNSSINLDKINMTGNPGNKDNINKFDISTTAAKKHILSDSDSLSSSEDSGNF